MLVCMDTPYGYKERRLLWPNVQIQIANALIVNAGIIVLVRLISAIVLKNVMKKTKNS